METLERTKNDEKLKKNTNVVQKPRENIKCQQKGKCRKRTQITGKLQKYIYYIYIYNILLNERNFAPLS